MNTEKRGNQNSMALEAIRDIYEASEGMITRLHEINFSDSNDDSVREVAEKPEYSIADVAKMLGKTVSALRKAESAGKIPPQEKLPNGRRRKYTLKQINEMREYWDCKPGRRSNDRPVILSFQNFKGGVGKTTLSAHCAQYLVSLGYRVLLVDADSQGSATLTFGYRPDTEIEKEHTLAPYLEKEATDLQYAIKPTLWDGLDIIPACLGLYGAEYHLAGNTGHEEGEGWLDRLAEGLATVEDGYDVIIIDPPPALGMISLSVLRAIDGLIIPTPPAMYDFHSTTSFFAMLEEVMEAMEEEYGDDGSVELDFVKILVSKKLEQQSAQFVSDLMFDTFGNNVLKNAFVQSAAITNAASAFKTVYDLEGPSSSKRTYKRCMENLECVFGEVEELIQAVWTSRRSQKALEFRMPDIELDEKEEAMA